MYIMRRWISAVTIIAFIATIIPASSHAAHGGGHASGVTKQMSCHDQAVEHKAEPGDHHKKQQNASDSCCDKGVCKCPNGSCHASLKIFNPQVESFEPRVSGISVFSLFTQDILSGMLLSISRPPNA